MKPVLPQERCIFGKIANASPMKNHVYSLFIFLAIIALSCSNRNAEQKDEELLEVEETVTTEETKTLLKHRLAEKKENWHLNTPDDKKQVVNDHIQDVINDSIVHRALQIGEIAPDFILTNAEGKKVSLYEYLKKGPVVLTWYRGGWCPYCNLTLHALQEELPNIQAAGGYLLALTPELPDNSLDTKEKHDLQFEVLSDVGNVVGHQYGIVYDLTPELADLYHKKFNIHSYNGDESNQLPLAATFVIDQRGIVEYAFLDPDYRNRAEPQEITKVLLYLRDHAALNSMN